MHFWVGPCELSSEFSCLKLASTCKHRRPTGTKRKPHGSGNAFFNTFWILERIYYILFLNHYSSNKVGDSG